MIYMMLMAMAVATDVFAAGEERPPSPEFPVRAAPVRGLIDPQTGEFIAKLKPKVKPSAREQNKVDALAHYLAGRIAMERRRIPAAVAEFEQAIQLDPESIEAYKAIVPILLTQRKMDEAREYVLDATRQTDRGYELLAVMASVYARQTRIDDGIALMRAALGSRSIPSGSREELLVHRDLGLFHRLNNEFETAAEEYRFVFDRVLAGDLSAEDFDRLFQEPGKNFDEFGDTFLKAGDAELALKAYEEASKYREAKPGLHSFNLATVLHQTGKPELALQTLQEYFDAQLSSRGRAPYVLLEKLLTELDREEEIQQRLETLVEEDPQNDVLRFYLAEKELARGEMDRAKQLYLNGAEQANDPRALVGLIGIYRAEHNSEKLLDVLTRAFQVVPRSENEDDLKRLDDDLRALAEEFESQLTQLKEDEVSIRQLFDYARTLATGDDAKLEFVPAYVLGKLATEGKFTQAAIDFYKIAISMRNDPPAMLYTEISSHLLDEKEYEEANAFLQEALDHPSNSLQSERWRFLFFLSYGHAFLGETELALDAIAQALGAAPDAIHGRLEYQKAWIYYHARRWDEARKHFEDVIQVFHDDQDLVQDARFRLSNVYVELDDMETGERILEEVLQDDPDNTQANNDLGYLWADQNKNLDRARGMIQKALNEEPDNPAYLDSMGWVEYRLGNFEKAVEYLQQATQQEHGDDSTIFDHLGDALHAVGKKTAAQAAYERALEIEEAKKPPKQKLLDSIRQKLQELDSQS